MIDITNILLDQYYIYIYTPNSSNTNEDYIKFIKQFEIENNIKIKGNTNTANGGWLTTGYEFNTTEDELIFILKYDN